MNLLQQHTKRKISLGQDGNSLVLLIVINVIVFIILSFTKILYLVNDSTEDVFKAQVLSWISVPAQPAVFAVCARFAIRPGRSEIWQSDCGTFYK